MKRPWIFVGALLGPLLVIIGAMSWFSVLLIRADRRDATMQWAAELEENSRLALWRMDAVSVGVIAAGGDLPLPYTKLLFAVDRSGRVCGPKQTHEIQMALADRVDGRQLLAASSAAAHAIPSGATSADGAFEGNQAGATSIEREQGRARNLPDQQLLRSQTELTQRHFANSMMMTQRRGMSSMQWRPLEILFAESAGPAHAVWVGDNLFVLQQAMGNGVVSLQGRWIDWESLEEVLLSQIADLLPHARLEPVETKSAPDDPYTLASLPVRLVPGPLPEIKSTVSSPIRSSLVVVWTASLVAILAVLILGWGVVVQSERRAAFVSAVTHELRTPLTTFRMYSEMLERGMVTGEEQRQQYLRTLREEAERLSQLVENVLSYARLERRRRIERCDEVTASELLERLWPRILERAKQSNLTVARDLDSEIENLSLLTNVSVVEQIVANLVDNACKYGASVENRIELRVAAAKHQLHLDVIDHGPGVQRSQRSRLFRPFHKSARESAETAPGVGLGLAISRRLARQLSGDLRIVKSDACGSRFRLVLPVV